MCGHAAFFAEGRHLQYVEHARVGAQAIETDRQVFGALVVHFEGDLYHLVAALPGGSDLIEGQQSQHVAQSGESPGSESMSAAQQSARLKRSLLRRI